MDKIKETCIIFSLENYTEGLYIKCFMEWIGISCFTFCYNEEFNELNSILTKKENKFDAVLYLNDIDARWRKRYQHLSKANIDVQLSDIWNNCNDKSTLQLNVLQQIWNKMMRLTSCKASNQSIMSYLIQVYSQHNAITKMLCKDFSYEIFTEKRDIKRIIEEWNLIIELLESFKKNNSESDCMSGMEHLDYAIKYSLYKRYELKELLCECESSEIEKIINSVNNIYSYNNKFYMGEYLKGKMAMTNIGQQIYAPFYFKNCVNACEVDACASEHYYHLGKAYELVGYQEIAYQIFEKSYELNQLNYRALFKIAVNTIRTENLVLAKKYLFQILRLLHLDKKSTEYESNMRKLPIGELEYACKCYLLLGMIEENYYGNSMNAEFYYKKAEQLKTSIKENIYIEKMYPGNCKKLKKYLSSYFLNNQIEKKINMVHQMEK